VVVQLAFARLHSFSGLWRSNITYLTRLTFLIDIGCTLLLFVTLTFKDLLRVCYRDRVASFLISVTTMLD
jgi:hypothetical protein